MSELLKEAIAGLSINVPIYRTEKQDGVLILYLYGGRVERWPPSTMATDPGSGSGGAVTTSPEPDVSGPGEETSKQPAELPVTIDKLTDIPGVGSATAKALRDAGFPTFRSLIDATDADILAVPKLTTYTLTKIRAYLYIHFP